MKRLISALVLVAASSSTAFALSAHDSWKEIFADHNYYVNAPYQEFGPNGIFNACSTATELKSIAPVKTCVESRYVPGNEYEPGHVDCIRQEVRPVSLARHGEASVCTEYSPTTEVSTGECIRWEKRPYDISLTQKVEVLYSGELYGTTAFVKDYTVPACAQ